MIRGQRDGAVDESKVKLIDPISQIRTMHTGWVSGALELRNANELLQWKVIIQVWRNNSSEDRLQSTSQAVA